MGLKHKIEEDMKLSLKSKDKDRLSVIRMILSGIKQKEIDDRITLNDMQIFSLLRKMKKQRIDSERIYIEANRQDLALKEHFEIEVIDGYLPEELSEEQISSYVNKIIIELGDVTINDMGKIMSKVKEQLSGSADMSLVSKIVKNYFQQQREK